MHHTLRKLLGGKAISTAELTRLLKNPQGAVALAALSRAHLSHAAATAELKRPPRSREKVRAAPTVPEAKKAVKSAKKRPV